MKELCVVSSSSIDHRVDVVNKFSEEREKKKCEAAATNGNNARGRQRLTILHTQCTIKQEKET